MKTSPFVSTSSVTQAVRHSLLRMQTNLISSQKELSTGRVADMGLALGSKTGEAVSFKRDMDRLSGIIDSNTLVSARLKSTQEAMNQMTTVAQTFLQTLTASVSGDASQSIVLTDARGTVEALTSVLNTTLNGEYLFAGINTDVKPVDNFNAPGSTAKAAFDAAFLGHFGFAQTAPAAANITGAQMDNFIDAVVVPQILGTGWETDWSSASDQGIQTRIALNETTETSVSANEIGIKKLVVAAAVVADLFSAELSQEARNALSSKALSMVGEGLSALADLQSRTGVVENWVKRASERLEMQVDLFERNILDMEGVDPYEAKTRVDTLLTQIEMSYALTARIQQLSLVKFLA